MLEGIRGTSQFRNVQEPELNVETKSFKHAPERARAAAVNSTGRQDADGTKSPHTNADFCSSAVVPSRGRYRRIRALDTDDEI